MKRKALTMRQTRTQPSSTRKAGSRAGMTRRSISSRGPLTLRPTGTSGAVTTSDLYRATPGPPSRLLPSPHPCTECLLWVRFCTRFGMGREGGEGGLPSALSLASLHLGYYYFCNNPKSTLSPG